MAGNMAAEVMTAPVGRDMRFRLGFFRFRGKTPMIGEQRLPV